MYSTKFIFLVLYSTILTLFIFNFNVSSQGHDIGLAFSNANPICNYEFKLYDTINFDNQEKVITPEVYCECGSESCSNQRSYTHTEQWSHTIGGTLDPLAFKGTLSITYSYLWGEAVTETNAINCEITPGSKGWATIIPKMTRNTGRGQLKCTNYLKTWIKESGLVTIDAPVIGHDGKLVGQVWCRTAQFKICSK